MDHLFEKATKNKYRFQSKRGLLNTEDLWDLKLLDLDEIAKTLNKALKEAQAEQSFITAKTKSNETLETKFELVKRIIQVKLQEKDDKENQVLKKQKKAQLLEIIQKKKESALEELSVEELERKLKDL